MSPLVLKPGMRWEAPGQTPRGRACLPFPPETIFRDNRYYMFGWEVSRERAEELVRMHCCWEQRLGSSPYTDLIYLLRRIYQYIYLMTVLPEGEPIPTPEPDPDNHALAFCITFTRSQELFFRRPTSEALQKLVDILGQPQWWRDYFPKNRWHDHIVVPR